MLPLGFSFVTPQFPTLWNSYCLYLHTKRGMRSTFTLVYFVRCHGHKSPIPCHSTSKKIYRTYQPRGPNLDPESRVLLTPGPTASKKLVLWIPRGTSGVLEGPGSSWHGTCCIRCEACDSGGVELGGVPLGKKNKKTRSPKGDLPLRHVVSLCLLCWSLRDMVILFVCFPRRPHRAPGSASRISRLAHLSCGFPPLSLAFLASCL